MEPWKHLGLFIGVLLKLEIGARSNDLYHQITWPPSYTWRCLKVTLLYSAQSSGQNRKGWLWVSVHWPMKEHGLQREPVALQIWSIWSNSSFCKTFTLLLTRPTVSPLIGLLFLFAWYNLYLSVLCWSDEYLRKGHGYLNSKSQQETQRSREMREIKQTW